MTERTYGGVTLEEIQQSPRSFGEVPVIEDLCARVAELEATIRWALGEGDEFPPIPDEPEPGKPIRRYWWRSELRRHANL